MQANKILSFSAIAAIMFASQTANAACTDTTYLKLSQAATTAASAATGGYGLNMWVTFVDESGKVCFVTTTGTKGAAAGNSAWLGSRVISAQKANTANDFSLDHYAISTANLYTPVQPGGSLFGLQESNPVNPAIAYAGAPGAYGTAVDPLINQHIGGVNVFGGGLAVYNNKTGKKIGAIGVSGDTSCRDHAFAWNVRKNLGFQPSSVAGITTSNKDATGAGQTPLTGATVGDEMIIKTPAYTGNSYWAGWAHPACPNSTGLTSAQNTANGVIILDVVAP